MVPVPISSKGGFADYTFNASEVAGAGAGSEAFSSSHSVINASGIRQSSFASAFSNVRSSAETSSSASAFASGNINILPNVRSIDFPPTLIASNDDTSELSPTTPAPSSNYFPIYAIVITALVLFAMSVTVFYFLCRCMAKKKKRKNQLATITPKMLDPRMAGVRANQPIQFVVPTTIIVSENTEDSVSETDYSSSGAKNLPIILDKRRKRTMSGFHINPDDLQHGLYVGVNAASEKGAFLGDLGKVGFSLSYNCIRNQLNVKLIGASELPCLFLKTTANPCAKVVLLPDRTTKYMTKVQRNTMNPEFNETFVFCVRRDDLSTKKLKISVWDYDRFSRKCLIGQVVYPLKDSGLTNSSTVEPATGDIWVNLKQDSPSHKSGNGEMLFSLCYNPDTTNLTLTVLKVKGLDIQSEKGKETSVYAKITLYVRRKLLKTKKTSSKRKTHEIEFSDTFNIHVPQASLGEVDLLVTLSEKSPGLGSKRILGRTQVGANCLCDQGLQHWQDMLMSPKSTCAQWHVLCG